MALTTSNIFHGPVSSVSLGGSDLGGIGENNVEITFEPVATPLADGQDFQMFGTGKITIELVELDTSNLSTISAAKDTAAVIVVVDLAGNTYTMPSMIINYSTKRSFGDDPHKVIITAKKKVADEDDFVTIS